MMNPMEILSKADPDFYVQKAKLKNLGSVEGLYDLNGKERMDKVLSKRGIDPVSAGIGLEGLIGEKNNLMDIYFLEKGLNVARTVCRLAKALPMGTKLGSGFLVGPGLLMTNNHVISSVEEARGFYAEFEYEKGLDGQLKDPFRFPCDPDSFFITNKLLDYTVIGVKPVAENHPEKKLGDYGWNRLDPDSENILAGEVLSIIQHPEGLPKMIAFRESQIIQIKEPFLHYSIDTQRGSSGSPVANGNWDIIALHHQGIPEKDEQGRIPLKKGGYYQTEADLPFVVWAANEGVLIDGILADIAQKQVAQPQEELKARLLESYSPGDGAAGGGYRLPG